MNKQKKKKATEGLISGRPASERLISDGPASDRPISGKRLISSCPLISGKRLISGRPLISGKRLISGRPTPCQILVRYDESWSYLLTLQWLFRS
jgi:hypothetical protein